MMCPSCNGIIGQDCFNLEDCAYIAMQQLAQQPQPQTDLTGLQAVYEKYKHLDGPLSDEYIVPDDDFPGHVRRELWLAVKEIFVGRMEP